VDWRADEGKNLDVLVIDMPPGTSDVQLTLGQLVKVDGAIIVSTPQDVALIDARKGAVMFRKVDIPILGLLLNFSHFTCPSCSEPHRIFGSPDSFYKAAKDLGVPVLGEIPLVPGVSTGGDRARHVCGPGWEEGEMTGGEREVRTVMADVGARVWEALAQRAS